MTGTIIDEVEPDSSVNENGNDSSGMEGVGRHTLIYTLGIILSKLAAFVMLPVYTRFLTPEDYGVAILIEMTLDVVAILAGAQLALGIFRFYHKAETEEERHAVVSTAVLGLGASYLIIAAMTYLGAAWIAGKVFGDVAHVGLIRIASVALFFSSMTIVPLAYARVTDRSTLFVVANFAKLVLSLSLNIYTLVYLEMGLRGVFVSTLISNMIVGLALLGWIFRSVGVRVSFDATKDLLRYGAPLMAMQMATFLATFSDRYFLNSAADSAAVGLYNLAYQFGFLLAAVGYSPFEMVWAPKRFEIAERDDRDEVLTRGFEFMNVLLLTCALGIAVYVEDVVRIMTQPDFYSAADLVPLILVAYVFQAWAGAHDIGVLIREKTEYITLANWVAAAVAVVGYWLLIPRYYGYGAGVATVIAFATRWVLTYWFSQRLWYVKYDWPPVIRLLLLALGGSVVALLLPDMSILRSLAIRTLIVGAYLVLSWRFALSAGAKEQIVNSATPKLIRLRERMMRRTAS